MHIHQGIDYRYTSWQRIETANATKGTKAPYYGNILVANVLANLSTDDVRITDLEQSTIYDSAYAAYVNGQLRQIAFIRMREYNYTNIDGSLTTMPRTNETFSFRMPQQSHLKRTSVQRLMANGSDAISGITFDGYSYNYELDQGDPVRLANVITTSRTEMLIIGSDGMLSLDMPWSSAAIINFY